MRPFNLTQALNDIPVMTRTGRVVTDMHQVPNVLSGRPSIVGVIDGAIYVWFPNGSYTTPENVQAGRRANQHTMDLFMGPEKRWANVLQEGNNIPKVGMIVYHSEADAIAAAKTTNLKVISTICYEV